jgi:hypothetical protein
MSSTKLPLLYFIPLMGGIRHRKRPQKKSVRARNEIRNEHANILLMHWSKFIVGKQILI